MDAQAVARALGTALSANGLRGPGVLKGWDFLPQHQEVVPRFHEARETCTEVLQTKSEVMPIGRSPSQLSLVGNDSKLFTIKKSLRDHHSLLAPSPQPALAANTSIPEQAW